MISKNISKICKDFTHIENYDKAIADTSQVWICHHRLETHNSDGEKRLVQLTDDELMILGVYYDRPASELIFLTRQNHITLHHTGKVTSEKTKFKMSNIRKGRKMPDEAKKKLSESNKRLRWWNNGVKEKHLEFCPDGFVAGRLPQSDRQKLINSGNKKGSVWWTNGIVDKFCKVCPEGFYKGRTNCPKGPDRKPYTRKNKIPNKE